MQWPQHAPELSDGVVTLRGLRPDDTESIVVACQDPLIPRYTTVPSPYTLEHAQDFVAEHGAGQWGRDRPDADGRSRRHGVLAITDAGSGEFAGVIDLQSVDLESGTATVGYWLGPAARGEGRGTRALRLLMSWALGEAGLRAIHWEAMKGNEPSRAMAEAVGFVLDGESTCNGEPAWTATLTPGGLRPGP